MVWIKRVVQVVAWIVLLIIVPVGLSLTWVRVGLLLWRILVVVAPLAGDQLGTQLGRAALEVVVRDLTSSLRFWALIAAGIGLVGAVGVWLGDRQRSRGANPDPIAA